MHLLIFNKKERIYKLLAMFASRLKIHIQRIYLIPEKKVL